jgi:alpha 1,3-glucosidase
LDFTFVGSKHVFGIPEHADKFSLQDTTTSEPYRLYNLDVFEYELWNPMALYASIPFMMSHNPKRSTGLFWLNAAETWVDVKREDPSAGVLGSISNFVGSNNDKQANVHAHFMSESGIIDAFILLGKCCITS